MIHEFHFDKSPAKKDFKSSRGFKSFKVKSFGESQFGGEIKPSPKGISKLFKA
jgi:hypothetical protein